MEAREQRGLQRRGIQGDGRWATAGDKGTTGEGQGEPSMSVVIERKYGCWGEVDVLRISSQNLEFLDLFKDD